LKVVTSGSAYLDIDAYAGCIGYAQLLNINGEEAVAASTAPPNESVTERLRGLGSIATNANGAEFVVVDVSEPNFFDPITRSGQVVEVIDHHPGFEQYWQEKLGDNAQIEEVGAACTQVVERWQVAGKTGLMTQQTAELLAAGILDNTLNFTAQITKERDHAAYELLQQIGELPEDFAARYFSDVQRAMEADLETAIVNDAKQLENLPRLPEYMGQFVVWDASHVVRHRLGEIKSAMNSLSTDWGMNLVSIAEARSYFLGSTLEAEAKLAELLGVEFKDGISEPHPMMLRKEILKAAISS
jgi:inorganic pyrophosphatase/exopolyphosphatase